MVLKSGGILEQQGTEHGPLFWVPYDDPRLAGLQHKHCNWPYRCIYGGPYDFTKMEQPYKTLVTHPGAPQLGHEHPIEQPTK